MSLRAGGARENLVIRPSRAAGYGRYRLVAAGATTAAVHDGEDHDGD
jgi:hypothetical protein